MILNNVLGAIGNTPLVSLNNLMKKHELHGSILAKLEFYSPGLSKKDRIAKYIIEKAEADGTLQKGQTVIEQTSGNTGIGVAAVCAVKGYPFIAVMSEGNSPERIMMIKQFNAQIVLVKQHPDSEKGKVNALDMELVEMVFNDLAEQKGAYKVGQFYKMDNALAHYYTTGVEIVNDAPNIDLFCDYVGTGGTFEGIAKRLKEHNKSIKCYIVEPSEAKHIIQGGGYLKPIPFADPNNCDGKVKVSNEEALYWMRELSNVEAIPGGISSGANLAACVKLIKEHPGKSIVFLVNDPSLKYLSANWMQDTGV